MLFKFILLFVPLILASSDPASNPIGSGGGSPPDVIHEVAGAYKDLSRSSINWSYGVTVTKAGFTIPVKQIPGLQKWTNGRASAIISWPLTVAIMGPVDDSKSIAAASTVCVIVGNHGTPLITTSSAGFPAATSFPITLDHALSSPGVGIATFTTMMFNPAKVFPPPLIYDELIRDQSIGREPVLICHIHTAGLLSTHLHISGTVTVSGIGHVVPF